VILLYKSFPDFDPLLFLNANSHKILDAAEKKLMSEIEIF
jgi:hypothetical protein